MSAVGRGSRGLARSVVKGQKLKSMQPFRGSVSFFEARRSSFGLPDPGNGNQCNGLNFCRTDNDASYSSELHSVDDFLSGYWIMAGCSTDYQSVPIQLKWPDEGCPPPKRIPRAIDNVNYSIVFESVSRSVREHRVKQF